MWSDNIMISYIHVNFVKHFTNSRNRTRTFLLERYMIQSIFPSNISPGETLHFCHGGTCHKVSFRQQELTKLIDFTRTSHVDIRRDNVLETEYFTENYVDNVHSPVSDIAHLSAILDDDLL